MIRMTITLAVALWATLVIWGEPVETNADAADSDTPVVLANATSYEAPVIVGDTPATPEVARTTPRPAPQLNLPRLINEPVVVSLLQPPAAAEPTPNAAPIEDVALPLYEVTGNRVNLRSGPSTNNPVVAALTRGTLTEGLGEEVNGWMEIRDPETGVTGFMAARFLAAF